MTKLLLWDIDGTLIHGGGVAGAAMRRAMEQVYGAATSQERRSYAGKTDQQIILEAFEDRPLESLIGDLNPFTQAYLAELNAQREPFLERAHVFEGVIPTLERLQGDAVIHSLLTGNLRPIAEFKLELLQIAQYFDFDSGAFGSDHHRRIELVPIATARASQRYGQTFSGSDVVVIGDTPFDIECGKAGGARTVAVATGPFSVEELREHAPDAVLADLRDTDAVLSALLG